MRLRGGRVPGPALTAGKKQRRRHVEIVRSAAPQPLLAGDALKHALQFAISDPLTWALVRCVCWHWLHCLQSPLMLGHVSRIVDQVYDGEPRFVHGELVEVNLADFARSSVAAGIPRMRLVLSSDSRHDVVMGLLGGTFRSLQHVDLTTSHQYHVTDGYLLALAIAAPKLISLRVERAQRVTEAGIACIAQFTLLQALTLKELNRGEVIVKALCELMPRLVALQELSFLFCGALLNDAALQALHATGALGSLRMLDLSPADQGDISNAGMLVVSRLTALRVLNLASCSQLADDDLRALAQLTALQDLNLCDLEWTTDAGLEALLPSLIALRVLDLHGCVDRAGGVGDAVLVVVSQLTALRELRLGSSQEDGCDRITDVGLRALAPLTALQELTVAGLGSITVAGLEALLASLTELRQLELIACGQITHDFHSTLRERGLFVECDDPVSLPNSPQTGDGRYSQFYSYRTALTDSFHNTLRQRGSAVVCAIPTCGGCRAVRRAPYLGSFYPLMDAVGLRLGVCYT